MIIKEFAKLCNCNPQTLRYYDSIDLLKPVKVDSYTGYRHYSAEQALQYVKIKKLQDADFSIEEIRDLINSKDDLIFEALNKKIAEQQAKLEEIMNIQKSYQKELKEMKNKIDKIKEQIMLKSMELDYKKEFGISEDEFYEIINELTDLADRSLTDEDITFNLNASNNEETNEEYTLIYELEFSTFKEALKQLPKFDADYYRIVINNEAKYAGNLAFAGIATELLMRKIYLEKDVEVDFSFCFDNNKKSIEIYLKI